jgi:hypothetical protein
MAIQRRVFRFLSVLTLMSFESSLNEVMESIRSEESEYEVVMELFHMAD